MIAISPGRIDWASALVRRPIRATPVTRTAAGCRDRASRRFTAWPSRNRARRPGEILHELEARRVRCPRRRWNHDPGPAGEQVGRRRLVARLLPAGHRMAAHEPQARSFRAGHDGRLRARHVSHDSALRKRVAERARKQGVEVELRIWPDMIHVWHAFADMLPEGQQAVDEMAAFLEARLAWSPT